MYGVVISGVSVGAAGRVAEALGGLVVGVRLMDLVVSAVGAAERALSSAAGIELSLTGIAAESGVTVAAPAVSPAAGRLRSPPQAAASARASRAALPAPWRARYRTASSGCSEAMNRSFRVEGQSTIGLKPTHIMMAECKTSGDPHHRCPAATAELS